MEVNWATPLYEFLWQCNASPLAKEVLDCGAGGEHPPLSIFHQAGYRTFGIELVRRSLMEAREFCARTGMALNILQGDMRRIPFASGAFSFIYSFNAIFFMKKADIDAAMAEIERVLKPGGLCFVNILSTDDPDRKTYNEDGRRIFGTPGFSYHEDDEADVYFANFELLRKEKRRVGKLYQKDWLTQVTLEYIAQKKGWK
jgi:SAM-dependent methyltransferase